MSVNFKQLDTSGLATTEDVDAIINDSEASGQSTYSSSKIDEDYQQKDSDISGGTVQYVASSSGNAPASGSMIGNIIGWLVGKCNGIGNISNLLTVAKSNLVAAINELRGEIGDLTQLDTTEKTDLVSAINELAGRGSSAPLTLVKVPKTIVTANCNYYDGVVTSMISINLPSSMGLGANTSQEDWRQVLTVVQYMFNFGIDSQNNVQQVICDANGLYSAGSGIYSGFAIDAKMDKMGMLEISLKCGSYMDADSSNFKMNAGDLYILVAKQSDLNIVTGNSNPST